VHDVLRQSFVSPAFDPQPNGPTKAEAGLMDSRTWLDKIPIFNLFDGNKEASKANRTFANIVSAAITILKIGKNILSILALFGIAAGVLSGPLGMLIVLALAIIPTAVYLHNYNTARADRNKTFNETGYDLIDKRYDKPLPDNEADKHVQPAAILCETPLPDGVSANGSGEKACFSEENENQLVAAGFKIVKTYKDNEGRTVCHVRNDDLNIGLSIVKENGSTYIVPMFGDDPDKSQYQPATGGIARYTNIIDPYNDTRTEKFEIAFREILKAYGGDVVLTGSYMNGMMAQYLALKYGLQAYCYNSEGIGPIKQMIIGQERIAENAKKVYHFTVPSLRTTAQKFADFIDTPVALLLGYRTLGNFGYRYEIQDAGATSISQAVQQALAKPTHEHQDKRVATKFYHPFA
jgi:hypothetical protein